MKGKSIYNWDTICRAFVTGDMLPAQFLEEYTGLDVDPKYQTLRKVAATEDWDGQRKAFVNNQSTQFGSVVRWQSILKNLSEDESTATQIPLP